MITINLTIDKALALNTALSKIIPAKNMLDERKFRPSYLEIMTLIEIANQLNPQSNGKNN